MQAAFRQLSGIFSVADGDRRAGFENLPRF